MTALPRPVSRSSPRAPIPAGGVVARPLARLIAMCGLAAGILLTAGCGGRADHLTVLRPIEGGDATIGRATLSAYGCSTCHAIPGVTGANGRVAPSLDGFARRPYIAGTTSNTPEHLVQWIVDPKSISPNTLMPNLNVGEDAARDIAAYLQTLR